MSWKDRLKNGYKIRTGDGKVFDLLWMNATKVKDFNIAEFDFPGVKGTLVTRSEPRGRKYGIEIYFEGDNHIEQANAFETSSEDKRPWVITHPLYDRLVVHPTSLNFDNTSENISKITGTLLETIEETNPRTSNEPDDKINADKIDLDADLLVPITDVSFEAADLNTLLTTNDVLFAEGAKITITDVDFENYFNAFNTANAAILTATAEPLAAMRELQNVINAPAKFKNSVQIRFSTLKSQYEKLRDSALNVTTVQLKRAFETNASAVVSSAAIALVTEPDFISRSEVVDFIDSFLETYNDFITSLDSLQDDSANSPDSYIPDFTSQFNLNQLVNFTIANLFSIAIDTRQERSIFLENDDNLITLTHRFLGPSVDDSNMDEFILINNVGPDEYLGLKKGRKIVYFV